MRRDAPEAWPPHPNIGAEGQACHVDHVSQVAVVGFKEQEEREGQQPLAVHWSGRPETCAPVRELSGLELFSRYVGGLGILEPPGAALCAAAKERQGTVSERPLPRDLRLPSGGTTRHLVYFDALTARSIETELKRMASSHAVKRFVYVFQWVGAEGLLDQLPGPKGPYPNRVSEEVEKAILGHALEHPPHGAQRTADELLLLQLRIELVEWASRTETFGAPQFRCELFRTLE